MIYSKKKKKNKQNKFGAKDNMLNEEMIRKYIRVAIT